MAIRIGEIEALFRYPVKSMAGEALDEAELGWHGVAGDRRLGLRRVGDRSGFPWLTATKLPELLQYTPGRDAAQPLPSHVRTPDGRELELFGEELAADVSGRHGSPVEMTHLDRGIFDEASVSAITAATVDALSEAFHRGQGGEGAARLDVRRFRPNLVLATTRGEPFEEDGWVGGTLSFGEGEEAASIAITNWDVRCAMINYDPDSGARSPKILETVVRERDNKAGVYGAVVRRGILARGQPVYFTPAG